MYLSCGILVIIFVVRDFLQFAGITCKENWISPYSPRPCYTVAHMLKYNSSSYKITMQDECHRIHEGFFARECLYLN